MSNRDAPERIWLDEPEDGAWWALLQPIGLNNAEYVRADLHDTLQAQVAQMREALEAAKKAAKDYCWQRYKGRDPLNLSSPAVFTSHEWQKISDLIDAALAASKESDT